MRDYALLTLILLSPLGFISNAKSSDLRVPRIKFEKFKVGCATPEAQDYLNQLAALEGELESHYLTSTEFYHHSDQSELCKKVSSELGQEAPSVLGEKLTQQRLGDLQMACIMGNSFVIYRESWENQASIGQAARDKIREERLGRVDYQAVPAARGKTKRELKKSIKELEKQIEAAQTNTERERLKHQFKIQTVTLEGGNLPVVIPGPLMVNRSKLCGKDEQRQLSRMDDRLVEARTELSKIYDLDFSVRKREEYYVRARYDMAVFCFGEESVQAQAIRTKLKPSDDLKSWKSRARDYSDPTGKLEALEFSREYLANMDLQRSSSRSNSMRDDEWMKGLSVRKDWEKANAQLMCLSEDMKSAWEVCQQICHKPKKEQIEILRKTLNLPQSMPLKDSPCDESGRNYENWCGTASNREDLERIFSNAAAVSRADSLGEMGVNDLNKDDHAAIVTEMIYKKVDAEKVLASPFCQKYSESRKCKEARSAVAH